MPYEISFGHSELCPQRLMARVLGHTGILTSLLEQGEGEGLICTVMDRSVPPDLVGVSQLQASGNFSYRYIVSVHNILPPAGTNTQADTCSFSLSTVEG
jgi:hypothetical protein